MYPYKLERNPFPSSPAARREQSGFLGGRRWKVARDRIKESFLLEGVPISVIVGPYGVGKTHLVFNLFDIFEDKGFITCYTELSGLSAGENPVIKAISQLLDAFRGFREEIVRSAIKKLEEDGRLNRVLKLNFSRFGAWKMRKKLNRYLNRGEDARLSREEKMFLRDTVLTMLDEEGVDKGTTKILLFSHSWKNILQTMDGAVNALSAMGDIIRIIGRNKIIMAFDELDTLEQKSSPHDITEPFRNLINHLPANVHLIFVITKSAMQKISTTDPGLHRRLDDKSKVCSGFLDNPGDGEELFEVIKDILGEGGAEIDIKGEDEIRGVCKVVFDKKKERPLSESLSLFNTLFEMVDGDGKNIIGKAYELLGVEPIEDNGKDNGKVLSKKIEKAIRNLCFRLKEIGKIRKVHEKGKRIYLKSGGWNVADVFFEDNEGKWVAGEVKVRDELVDALKLHIPEIMREGFFRYGGVEKKVDRAVLWYLAKGLRSEVESKIEELRKEGKEVDEVKLSEGEVKGLGNLEDKDLEDQGKRLRIVK